MTKSIHFLVSNAESINKFIFWYVLKLFFRFSLRSISSVVPKSDISVSDFKVVNEPVLGYLPGSQERSDLEAAIKKYEDQTEDVPIVIGGQEYRTEHVQYQPMVNKWKYNLFW